MKDHEIRDLVNAITKEVKRIHDNSPQCLRETISRIVNKHISTINK